MKVFIVLFTIIVLGLSERCYDQLNNLHNNSTENLDCLSACRPKYGSVQDVMIDMQHLVSNYISYSVEYMLMSAHFGSYVNDRPGLRKLYQELSDTAWNDAVHLIKFISKRGGVMHFEKNTLNKGERAQISELDELTSLGRAVDIQKSLAGDALILHSKLIELKSTTHDSEIDSYVENQFVQSHAYRIRKLSGYVTDLVNLLDSPLSPGITLYIYDNYLLKSEL